MFCLFSPKIHRNVSVFLFKIIKQTKVPLKSLHSWREPKKKSFLTVPFALVNIFIKQHLVHIIRAKNLFIFSYLDLSALCKFEVNTETSSQLFRNNVFYVFSLIKNFTFFIFYFDPTTRMRHSNRGTFGYSKECSP